MRVIMAREFIVPGQIITGQGFNNGGGNFKKDLVKKSSYRNR